MTVIHSKAQSKILYALKLGRAKQTENVLETDVRDKFVTTIIKLYFSFGDTLKHILISLLKYFNS